MYLGARSVRQPRFRLWFHHVNRDSRAAEVSCSGAVTTASLVRPIHPLLTSMEIPNPRRWPSVRSGAMGATSSRNSTRARDKMGETSYQRVYDCSKSWNWERALERAQGSLKPTLSETAAEIIA